ncbi:MAG: DNA primase [Flavobacteriales bacterium]|nr:DNA primase [Flavobacteriales bacterium]
MIPREVQEHLKALVRIEEVVGEFVQLKRRGKDYVALCPFHDERTPSFSVSPRLGIYKCFGCGRAGDAIGFLKEHERLSYEDALRWLARKYNVDLKETEKDPGLQAEESRRESLYVLNEFALKFFRERLHMEPPVGYAYLKERGLSDTVIEKFQLGYAPAGRYDLRDALKQAGYSEELALQLGLLKRWEDTSEVYDAFRDRVIFPIHSLTGRVIGFGGRLLRKSDSAPKYLNSPESEIYVKSRTLYGLHLARRAIIQADNCYLAEGYMDVIALHEAGIENVVASSGTSLTEEQIKLLRRFTNKVTLLYDGDRAGILAALRGADLMLEKGLQVRVVLLPEGEDPDSFSRKVGAAAFAAFLEAEARDIVGFKASLLLEQAGRDPLRRAEALRSVLQSIARIPDSFARNELAIHLARMAEMEERTVLYELHKARRAFLEQYPADAPSEIPETISKSQANISSAGPSESDFPEERALLRWLILYGREPMQYYAAHNALGVDVCHRTTVWKFVRQNLSSDNYTFLCPEGEVTIGLLESYYEQNLTEESAFEYLKNRLPEEAKETIIRLCADAYDTVSEGWNKRFGVEVTHEKDFISSNTLHLLNALREERVRHYLKQCRDELRTVTHDEQLTEILNRIRAWEETKKELAQELGRVVLE